MVSTKNSILIRKIHRYLGLFLGIQFFIWSLSGLYFSWTDIDEIHGDHFRKTVSTPAYEKLLGLPDLAQKMPISQLELRSIAGMPYYWINDRHLVNATTGEFTSGITREQALQVAADHMRDDLKVSQLELLEKVGKHHEYRGRPLPVYQISYLHPENVVAYVSQADGRFQRVRYRSWRWFDFLWMTHVMDFEGRDDINNQLLRLFSLLGLITVLSGFLLWFVSSSRFGN